MIKEGDFPCVFWPMLIILLSLCLLVPATIHSLTNSINSFFYVHDEVGQYVLMASTILASLIAIILIIVFFEQNLKYLELVIEGVYNFDEDRSVSNISRSSNSD
jgi:hypothetical protein